ncbi:3'-5' exonuclease [Cellvibrio mixtus]|uniref:3'-5' exonuclease n=1 Tax=Cellvibrio mixtus TaxID=39650 RepID=UPI000587D36C|nr:3'-5' exonuclease [Cellvibrio mixtus]
MATIIPNINSSSTKMTPGERRFGQRLEKFLEDDYLCWFDVPVGAARRYPDFIILHPGRGLLFLEVKDWKLSTIKSMTLQSFTLLTSSGSFNKSNPIEQARQCAYQVVNKLKRDNALVQADGKHQGNLVCPYGYGVVFTNISRKQLLTALGEDGESILPAHLVICQDEMMEKTDAEEFQQRLWNMFSFQFSQKLSLPQIDRIRAHLFPEIRIGSVNEDLFASPVDGDDKPVDVPDIVKVMDMQQEQLARSFGEGHRVVHGVAGSGKTLILGFRCWYLAQTQSKPILVLCYNISLAAKLRAFMREKGIEQQVQVYHFHDWCGQQLRSYHVNLIDGKEPVWERQVLSVIKGVEQEHIPRAQYGAVLIDEGHDFEAEWLKLIVGMIDPETNALLLLYDDAQAIYKKKSNLNFTLSSVGIQARGRTSILKLNYRNTREILHFAFDFAKEYLQEKDADEDSVPLIKPQMGGKSGQVPAFRLLSNRAQELSFIRTCLKKWHDDGVAWSDMAVIYCHHNFGEALMHELNQHTVPNVWMGDSKNRRNYDPLENKVLLVTRQSSKGLEFPRVIVAGLGVLKDDEEAMPEEARLLYVAMTRAQQFLLLTSSVNNHYAQKLVGSG